jgi:hypothetical protein
MKLHFYSPNPMIFQKKHLNDVKVHIFFHFQVHTMIIIIFKSKNMGLEKIYFDIKMDFTNLKFSF